MNPSDKLDDVMEKQKQKQGGYPLLRSVNLRATQSKNLDAFFDADQVG